MRRATHVTWRNEWTAPALAVAALAAALITQFTITSGADVPYYWLGFVLAAVLLAGATWQLQRAGSRTGAPRNREVLTVPPRLEWVLMALIILLAAFFRFWRFFDFPSGIWYDEGVIGQDALYIIDEDHFVVWRETNFGRATLYIYALAASFKVFGYTVFAMRLVPALSGLAAVIAFYFLARWLVGVVPALIATALLAVSRYAVTFSRISWDAAMQPFFEILAVYFFVRAMETRSKLLFALAGASMAAGLYTYVAFRFVPFVIIAMFVYVLATRWRMARQNVAGLVVYGVTAIALFAPLGWYAVTHQDEFFARSRDVNVFREVDERNSYEPLRHNIEASVKMINVEGDRNPRHNLPRAPMLDEITAALFILGLTAAVYAFRDWRRGSIPIWLVLMLLPGALTIVIENPSAIRGVGAIPPMYLLAGMGVASIYRTVPHTRAAGWAFAGVAGVLVAGSVAINYRDFFERQVEDIRVYDSFIPTFTDVATILGEEGPDRDVYVSEQFDEHPSMSILGRGAGITSYAPMRELVLPYDGRDAVIVLGRNQFGLVPTLQQIYPGLEREDDVDPYGRTFFTTLKIPAADIERLHQIEVTEGRAGGGPGTPAAGRFGREFTEADVRDGPLDVVWEGYIWMGPRQGVQELEWDVPGTFALEVDGERVLEGRDDDRAIVNLTPGQHRVRVAATIERPGTPRMTLIIAGVQLGDFSRTMYGSLPSGQGFQLMFRETPNFSAAPVATTEIPFAVSIGETSYPATEYRAVFTVEEAGVHGFALDGNGSAQLLIDDALVTDNGGAHPPRSVIGTINLDPGDHILSVQHTTGGGGDWGLQIQRPGGELERLHGAMLRPVTAPFEVPELATFVPEWERAGRPIEGIERPVALAVLPSGELVVAGGSTLAFLDPAGALLRTVDVDGVSAISDVDALPDGRIAVADPAANGIVVVDQQGDVVARLGEDGPRVNGIDAQADAVYGASPSEGAYVRFPLDGSPVTSQKLTESGSSQPSDVVLLGVDTILAADFERARIFIFPPGGGAITGIGAGGSGAQLPRLATHNGLALLADPLTGRLIAIDPRGRQRGLYVFPRLPSQEPIRPAGIDVSPDGGIYTVDMDHGALHRFRLEIPPGLADELSEQPP